MHAKPAILRAEEGATWALPHSRVAATRGQMYSVGIIAIVHGQWFMDGEKNLGSVAGINNETMIQMERLCLQIETEAAGRWDIEISTKEL